MLISLVLAAAARACVQVDVTAVMNTVGETLDRGTPEAGLDALTAAWNTLPDACGAVAPADIALLAYRAGALALDLHHPELADPWFEWPCALVPDAALPGSLPAAAKARARAACERVAARPTADVLVESPVMLDGVPRETGNRYTVKAGVHLLTWVDAGEWHGRWQTLEQGEVTGVPSGTLIKPPQPPARTKPKLGTSAALVGVGAGAAGAGVAVFQVLFANRWAEECNGHGYDLFDHGLTACHDELGVSLAPALYGGIGLVAGGAALGLTGVGLGIHAFVTPTSTGATVTLVR